MAQVDFVTYGEDGNPIRKGRCNRGDLPRQLLDGEAGLIEIPDGVEIVTEYDMGRMRQALVDRVDDAAASLIAPGRKPLHARKLAEARAGKGPLIAAEAKAAGMTIKQLAARIIEKAAEQDELEVRVELARRKAKMAIRAAGKIGEAHRASQVDWEAVAAPDGGSAT